MSSPARQCCGRRNCDGFEGGRLDKQPRGGCLHEQFLQALTIKYRLVLYFAALKLAESLPLPILFVCWFFVLCFFFLFVCLFLLLLSTEPGTRWTCHSWEEHFRMSIVIFCRWIQGKSDLGCSGKFSHYLCPWALYKLFALSNPSQSLRAHLFIIRFFFRGFILP